MNSIHTELWTYLVKREVPCVVCGRFYEHAGAVVMLMDGANGRGHLCPNCLATPTSQAAERLREHAARLDGRSPVWAQGLTALANKVEHSAGWGVTVAALRAAEQGAQCPRSSPTPSREWATQGP